MSKPLLSRTLAANASAAPTDVHTIKTVLKMLGHYQAPDWGVDEFPDRALFDALRTFQKNNGLKVDGYMKPGGESETALKAAAQMVRAQGRNGDTVLAHITPAEAALLDKVTDGGSINPATGLPEYFIGDMLGELGSGFTSLGDGLLKTLPNLSEDFVQMGLRSARPKEGGLLGDTLGQTVTDDLGVLAKKRPSNPLGSRRSPSLGIGLEIRADKPTNPGRVDYKYVISENENADRANTQRPAPVSIWGVLPATPKIAPAMPILQNSDRLRQWVKDAQAQTRTQPQFVPPVSAEASASNARTADALSKTQNVSAITPHLISALETVNAQGRAEVQNLIEHMDQRVPGHGQKLAAELGGGAQALNKYPTAAVRKAARHVKQPRGSMNVGLRGRTLKGTTFFGGAGMEGKYIQDMVKSFHEAGLKNVRAADPSKWSSGNLVLDAASVPFENSRDSSGSDFSSFGEKGDQFNLVGYSYGGLQAAQAAADYADQGGAVDNLVLIGTPIEKEFLTELQKHPNIKRILIVDLNNQDDPIKAGMSDFEVVKFAPKLVKQILSTNDEGTVGHFYFSDEGDAGKQRRRALALMLSTWGLR